MRRNWGLLAVALALLLILVLRWQDEAADGALLSPPQGDVTAIESHESAGIEESVAQPEFAEGEPSDPPAKREDVRRAILHGSVVDSMSDGIESAVLTWSAPSDIDLNWEPAWQADDWGPLDRSTVRTVTGADGEFAFDKAPVTDSAIGSLLWVQRAGFSPRVVHLSPEWSREPRVITLQRAAPIQALVVDGQGRPVAGARIDHYGMTPAGANRGTGFQLSEVRALRHLNELVHTDAMGFANLSAYEGEQVLQAKKDGYISLPWKGRATARVKLQLQDSFEVGGLVELPDWSHLDYEGERRILISALEGHIPRPLASIRHVAEGEWGPISLPHVGGWRYEVRLVGSPIIPVVQQLPPVSAGTTAVVDLIAELGHDLMFVALDEDGEILKNSEALVWWEEEGLRKTLRRRAMEDGFINPWSVPAGTIEYALSAPGHVTRKGGLVEVPMQSDGALAVTLPRAGEVRGRCLHRGAPVPDFEVVAWGRENSHDTQSFVFHGRADGTFELDTVPIGEVLLTASSPALPPCKPVAIDVPELGSVSTTVILELESPMLGEGIVLDRATGEPLLNAEVQMLTMGPWRSIGGWGDWVPVDFDGSFKLLGFSPGQNAVRARAPGYAPAKTTMTCGASECALPGRLTLDRTQGLELHLISEDASLDPSQWRANAFYPQILPHRRFGGDRAVQYENVRPGRHEILIKHVGTNTYTRLMPELVPGEEWVISTLVAGGRQVRVEVVKEDGTKALVASSLFVAYRDSNGVRTLRVLESLHEGAGTIDGIDATSIMVEVFDPRRNRIGTGAGVFEGEDELHLRVQLGLDPLRVHVLDPMGSPVSGASVAMISARHPVRTLYGETDGTGVVEFMGALEDPSLLYVKHPQAGTRFGAPWTGGPGEIDVTLSAEGQLRLRFLDGEVPIGGVETHLMDASGEPFLPGLRSDNTGLVVVSDLHPGPIQTRNRHPGCWPVSLDATATVGARTTEVQIRRLGDLEFEVLTLEGAHASGVQLDLRSLDFETRVQSWLEQGLARGSLTTDSKGLARVSGLPNGAYRVSVRDGGPSSEASLIHVHPGVATHEELRFRQ